MRRRSNLNNTLRRAGWRGLLWARSALSRRVMTPAGRVRPFFHWYNKTWRNERQLEVPLALAFVANVPPASLLEVGNVLAHYGVRGHRVVDLFERHPAVENVDIVDFEPGRRFTHVLAISTLEHVGWDEPVRDPAKFARAVAKLQACAAPGGHVLATLPLGHNPQADRFASQPWPGWNVECFQWDGPGSSWTRCAGVPTDPEYDYATPTALAVAVCRWQRAS